MKKLYLLGCAVSALTAANAHAQSTGSIDFQKEEIVVTGVRGPADVAGVIVPDAPKARAVLTQEFIGRQVPGQTINEVINQLPGVSFQNNDPFGSAGGTLMIRGFDDSRISQTFDGVPLNDTGNYALYTNQQLDPELIDEVNVNLGTTDVDSPTAAASGSTVNYLTHVPTEDFHVRLQGSAGDYSYFRVFGMVDTGTFTPWGTRAFFSASHAENDNVFNHRGKIDKQQYNARIYQPLGSNGDFISIAGHYNQNRNNFFGSVPLRTDQLDTTSVPNRFPVTKDERFYTIARCQTVAPVFEGATPGDPDPDAPNSCGSSFDERYNPSNTGNIRGASRFTLTDGLILTVDPSYQYVKANGGGTVNAREGFFDGPVGVGYIGGAPYLGGIDLNGDGDVVDQVRVLAPSQTQTHRYGVIASLRYDISEQHTVRLAYTFDRGRHRQTGQVGLLQLNGEPFDVFPVNDPLEDATGSVLQKRDRLSYAILNQVSGEYRGEFLDDRLVVNLGVRAPFFKRELNNHCFTTSASGFVDCFGGNEAADAAYAAANPTVQGPQRRVFKYDKVLPSAGMTFEFMPNANLFASFSQGIQVPGTDNLYNSFFFAPDEAQANPKPETTDNFDLGIRYNSSRIQALLAGWYTIYHDRLASAYDPEIDRTVYRNLGRVDKYGFDASIAYRPIDEVTLYAYGSYLHSKIKDNVALDATTEALTKGKRESAAPEYTFGGRAEVNLAFAQIGVQAKRTGPRYINDQNLPVIINGEQVYGAKTPAYTLVDIDVRVPLEWAGLNDRTYFQFNVTNLFDKLYVGGFDGTLVNTSTTFVQIGSPRAFTGTLVIGF